MVAPTAIPAMAPFDMPSEEADSSADASEMAGVAVVNRVSAGPLVDAAALLVSLVDCVEVEELVLVELCAGLSLPTEGGPSVLPSRAWAACLMASAVSPLSPGMLKRSE